jgi:hypothetical protein
MSVNTSNVTIDGSYRTTAESGYGFKIQAASNTILIQSPNSIVTTGTTIKYVELTHTSVNTSAVSAISLYGNGGNLIQYVYAHDLSGGCFRGAYDSGFDTNGGLTDTTIEESVCGDVGMNTGPGHTELLIDFGPSSNTIIRNNVFYNWGGSFVTGGLILGGNETDWSIYNNIFTERNEDTGGCGNGIISGVTAGSGWTGIRVFNNTFANISKACGRIFSAGLGDFSGAGNEVKNNLFYNTTVTGICTGGCTKSNNWFYLNPNYTLSGDDISGNADPFVDSPSENLHLAAGSGPIDIGLDLSSYFTTDILGTLRPQGLAWDIGAYEYTSVTPTYSVGGTVSGLSGTAVLQNNGGDNLSISSNGSFTFSTSLTSGSSYSVTILSQPSGETCTISNGSGTVSANVTTISVSCTDDPTPPDPTPTTTVSTPPSNGPIVGSTTHLSLDSSCLSGFNCTATASSTAPVSPDIAALQSQLASLLAQVAALQAKLGLSSSTTFSRDLSYLMTGPDVKELQQYLNSHGFLLATTGPGSPSHETTLFGDATRYQLSRFQKAHGISPAVGYFGVVTRGYVNSNK